MVINAQAQNSKENKPPFYSPLSSSYQIPPLLRQILLFVAWISFQRHTKPAVLKVWSRNPKISSGSQKGYNYFHENAKTLFAFFLAFSHKCTAVFQRLRDRWRRHHSVRGTCEADMRIQLSSVKTMLEICKNVEQCYPSQYILLFWGKFTYFSQKWYLY